MTLTRRFIVVLVLAASLTVAPSYQAQASDCDKKGKTSDNKPLCPPPPPPPPLNF